MDLKLDQLIRDMTSNNIGVVNEFRKKRKEKEKNKTKKLVYFLGKSDCAAFVYQIYFVLRISNIHLVGYLTLVSELDLAPDTDRFVASPYSRSASHPKIKI